MNKNIGILVVDDDHDFREVICDCLHDLPYDFALAESGSVALKQLKTGKFDIVVTDIKMPLLNGLQLLERVKQDWPEIDVVVMTGYSEEYSYSEVILAGAIDYIVKPFASDEFQARLQRVIREKQTRTALRNLSAELEAQVQDQTRELRETNKDLSEIGNRYRKITSTITNYIYTVKVENGQSVESIHNPACEAVTGYTAGELSGSPGSVLWLDMIPVEDQHLVLGQIERIFANEKPGVVEHRIIKKDGTLRWISNTPILHYNGEGRLVSYDSVVRDINERKIAEMELQNAHDELEQRVKERTAELHQANQQLQEEIEERMCIEEALKKSKTALEKANIAKSEFLANMSHEIRTPMNTVLGMTRLAQQFVLSEKVRKYLTAVETSGNILLGVINDILDFSKIESGKLPIENIQFNLHDMLFNLEAMFLEKAVETGNRFSITPQSNIPDALIGDPLRLGQILVNLVSNAMKFTSSGEVSVTIICRESTPDMVELQFSVVDTGIGIKAEQIDKIFSPFSQADASVTRRFGGTGLGLTISRKLIEILGGGDLQVTSVVNQGSNFTFTLPLGSQPVGTTQKPSTDLQGKKILITDDDPVVLEWLKQSLMLSRFEVETADRPSVALRKIREKAASGDQFDLMIMDIMMPEQDGVTTAKEIRNDPLVSDIPIIILTGYGSSLAQQRAESVGVNSFLHKPISLKLLLENINQVLSVKDIDQEKKLKKEISPAELLRGGRVLLVEDNLFNQWLAREVLENAGITVEVAGNGKEALDKVNNNFDAILMDVEMPEMDGFEATREIRKLNGVNTQAIRRIPIVAMTAHAMSGDQQKCIDAGMDDYVTKPFRAEALYAVLARHICGNSKSRKKGTGQKHKQSGDDRKAIDWTCIKNHLQTAFQLDHQQVEEMLVYSKQTLREELIKGKKYHETGDFEQLGRVAHGMKGILRSLNLNDYARLAERIEKRQHREKECEFSAQAKQFEHLHYTISPLLQ